MKKIGIRGTVFDKMNSLYGKFYQDRTERFHRAIKDNLFRTAAEILFEFPETPKKLARIYAYHIINSGNRVYLETAQKFIGRKFNQSEMNRFKKVAEVANIMHS